MTQNQKLREVFEARMTDNGKWPRAVEQGRNGCYLLAQTENAWAEWQACAEALALPTADHLPDAGKMVNGLTQAETDASASVSGLTAEHRALKGIPSQTCSGRGDLGSPLEATAAPVGERDAFEREMRCEEEWGHRSLKKRQNGKYENWQVDLMWAAWQARAALSAGDAVDAQRYRWLADCNNYHEALALMSDGSLTADALGKAIDAAMRKDKL